MSGMAISHDPWPPIPASLLKTVLRLPLFNHREAGEALGSAPDTPINHVYANQASGVLLGLPFGSERYYPAFQFDPRNRGVWTAVQSLNIMLNAAGDPWGAAAWWVNPNEQISGNRAPIELFGQENLRLLLGMDVVAAAAYARLQAAGGDMERINELQNTPFQERAQWGVELAEDHEAALEAASSIAISSERMWEIVESAFDYSSAPTDSLHIRLLAVQVATTILNRSDCPYELLMFAATHPELDTRLPGHILSSTVLARPDCPEEIKVAAALINKEPLDK